MQLGDTVKVVASTVSNHHRYGQSGVIVEMDFEPPFLKWPVSVSFDKADNWNDFIEIFKPEELEVLP